MQNQFSRTEMLMGKAAIDTLAGSRVAVFGIGGVGGYVAEVLARSGVGEMDVFDNDRVCLSNLNRQIYALLSTVGQFKVDVAERRIHDINPQCIVNKHKVFYLPANADETDLSQYDYVVDCIDTISAKIELAVRCHRLGVPIISCMGAANKLDATAFRISDITKTKMDPLAKVMRKKLKDLGVPHLKVVYSEEPPLKPIDYTDNECGTNDATKADGVNDVPQRRNIPASNAFVPAAAGLIVAGEVVKDLIAMAGTMRIPPQDYATSEAAKNATAKAEAHLLKVRQLSTVQPCQQ